MTLGKRIKDLARDLLKKEEFCCSGLDFWDCCDCPKRSLWYEMDDDQIQKVGANHIDATNLPKEMNAGERVTVLFAAGDIERNSEEWSDSWLFAQSLKQSVFRR